jgi:8-oxo-dGTP pyrophosphatase MutT (NUDIX family)
MQPSDWRQYLEQAVRIDRLEENPTAPTLDSSQTGRPAAVLVAVAAGPEPAIYFARRSEDLAHHPGQISFPGGGLEPEDVDLAAAALREAKEEIDLDESCVTLLGPLPALYTGTGFTIAPFVGWVDPVPPLQPDGIEIVDIFSVPLPYIVDSTHYRAGIFRHRGRDRPFYAIDYDGHYIWGATASILIDLAQRLAWVYGRPFTRPSTACRKGACADQD